jgi:GntR family transcriptional regulator, transcriptional repressor for pyruvate dehydrogenase complex
VEAGQFTRVPKRKVSDEIFLMLQEKIFLGELKAGEKLPPERELSSKLGVTRVPLREALKRLQAMNLIEVRHGDGIYVLDYEKNAGSEFLMSVIQCGLPLEKRILHSILEFRLIVVPELFRLAAANAKQEHIDRLEEIVAAQRGALNDRQRMMELDFEFHTEVTRASGNLFAQLLYNTLRPVYLTLSQKFFEALPDMSVVPENADRAVQAIKDRDGERLAAQARFLLQLVDEFMLSEFAEDVVPNTAASREEAH